LQLPQVGQPRYKFQFGSSSLGDFNQFNSKLPEGDIILPNELKQLFSDTTRQLEDSLRIGQKELEQGESDAVALRSNAVDLNDFRHEKLDQPRRRLLLTLVSIILKAYIIIMYIPIFFLHSNLLRTG